jgi:hypothetical protein
VGANGLAGEVMMKDGSIRKEALANLRLHQAQVTVPQAEEGVVIWNPHFEQQQQQ